jgi:pro-sigmaK processing inhibitor BofA
MPLLIILVGAGCLLVVARCAAHQKHPFRGILADALCGIAALALVNLSAAYTGITLPINAYTAFAGAVLGLPGIILLLALHLVL